MKYINVAKSFIFILQDLRPLFRKFKLFRKKNVLSDFYDSTITQMQRSGFKF